MTGSRTVNKLFIEGARATDFKDRGVFYKQAQAIIAEELYMHPA